MRATTSWASLEERTKEHSWLLTLLSKLCGRWVASMMMSFLVGDVIDKQSCGGMSSSDGPLSLTGVNNPLAAGQLTHLAVCPYEEPLLLIEEEEGLVPEQALLLVNRSDHDSASSSQTTACWDTFLQFITTKNNLTSSSSVSPLPAATCHFALASQPGDSQQYNETSWGSRPADSPADCMTPIIHRTGSHGSIDEKGHQVTEMMPSVVDAPAASGQRLVHRGSLQDDYDDATAPISSLLYGSSRGARSISHPGGSVMSFTSFDLTTSPVSVVIPGTTTGGNFNETTRALMMISSQEEQHQQCDEYLPLLMSLRSALAASEARNEELRLCAEESGIRYRKDRMELENELMELKKLALQVICENEALKEGRGLLLQQVQNERTKAVMSPIHALPREQLSDLMWKTGKKLGKGGCAEVFELVDEVEDAASSMSFAFKKALPGCGFMIESEVVALQSARGPGVMAVESVVMCNEVLEGRSGRPEDMTPVGYTMEQMDGCLESLLRKKISPPQFIAVMARCATSLAQLHQAGYLHCDVKPGNLLYKGWPGSPSFQVKVSDLGHARPFEADKGHEGVAGPTLGTAYIQAPECFTEARVCSKADVWSVGIMMYVYLSQRYPYKTKSNRYLDQDRTEMKIRRGSRPDVLQVSNISKVVGDWELDFPIAAVEMLDLMSSCLQEDPCHRPCMADLASSLSCLEQRCLLVPAAQLDVACMTATCLEDEVEEDHPLGMMVQDPLPQLPDSLGFSCGISIPSFTIEHNTWQEAAVLGTSGTESIMGEDPLGMMVQDPLPQLPDSLGFSCGISIPSSTPEYPEHNTWQEAAVLGTSGTESIMGEDPLGMMVQDPLPQLPDSLDFSCGSSIPSSTPEHNTWQEAAVLDTSGTESMGEDPLGMILQDPLPQLPDSLGFSCGSSIPSSTPEHNPWQEAAVLDTSGTESMGEDPLVTCTTWHDGSGPTSSATRLPGLQLLWKQSGLPPSLAMRTTCYVASSPESNMRGACSCDGDGACYVSSSSVVCRDIDLAPLPVLPDSLGF